MPRSIVAELSDQLAARIEDLCVHLFPRGHLEGSEWRVGSIAGEPGDSLGIHLEGNKAGIWSDFSDGDLKGDPFDLVRAVRQCSVAEAIEWSKAWLGIASTNARQESRNPAEGAGKSGNWARKLWEKSLPAPGTAVETYLRSRGLSGQIPPAIRFAKALKYADGIFLPGMVSAVTSAAGELVGVHRTFLAPDGSGKADVPEPKKSMGRIKGAAVHLAPAGPRLGVSEGIETGLSVAQVWPALPVWAALSAPGLQAIGLPEDVRLVVILVDADVPGERAAQAAARRFHGEGREVYIARPAPDRDFNDMLRDGTLGGTP